MQKLKSDLQKGPATKMQTFPKAKPLLFLGKHVVGGRLGYIKEPFKKVTNGMIGENLLPTFKGSERCSLCDMPRPRPLKKKNVALLQLQTYIYIYLHMVIYMYIECILLIHTSCIAMNWFPKAKK